MHRRSYICAQVVPYWGNTQDRKILRKFWSQENMHMKEASFHMVITSYQLIIQDIKYFQRIKWQYMILDEAQALKSSSRYEQSTILHHRLRGSGSAVVTMTSKVNGKMEISTPCRSETP